MSRSGLGQTVDGSGGKTALVLYAGERRQSAAQISLRSALSLLEERPVGAEGCGKIGLALSPSWYVRMAFGEAGEVSDHELERLRRLWLAGAVELLAYPAAEPMLPLLRTEEAIYAQLAAAMRELECRFGLKPRGVLLPGGAFTPGIDRLLRELGADYAIAGANTVRHAVPAAGDGSLGPIVTPYGIVLLPAGGSVIAAELGGDAAEKWLQLRNAGSSVWVTPAELAEDGRSRLRFGLPAEASWEPDSGAAAWLNEGSASLLRHLHEAETRMIELARQHEHGAPSATDRALRQAAQALMQLQDGNLLREAGDAMRTAIAVQRFHDRWRRFDEACRLAESGEALADAESAGLRDEDDPWPGIDWRDYAPRVAGGGAAGADLRELIRRTNGQANIVMLAWEYPPKQVGGLACAVCDLAESLAAQGRVVHVVTTVHDGAPPLETVKGVHVHRVRELSSGPTDFYHWTFEWNLAIVDYLIRWKELGGRIDILHAHDWIVFHAARELKLSCGIPLVATIHATEWGRHQGNLHSELQRSIHELEYRLTYEASEVIVCSEYMQGEVIRLFGLPPHKVHVFPNGIQLEDVETPGNSNSREPAAAETTEERRQWAADGERILFFIGRLVYEKGLQTLLEAMPAVWKEAPDTKLIVAGSGPMEDEWRRMAAPYGDRVRFVGYADAAFKERLYRAADIVVIPSWYEPFGIVALEAMKYGKPLVISDTGGLAEIVDHGVNGFKALPGRADSLASFIAELLRRPELGRRMAAEASRKLRERYTWPGIAAKVASLYRELLP
jgi:1,4-alpha-glucan branching enzyme